MFSANHIDIKEEKVTLDIIQSRVSELDIFKMYCNNFTEIGKCFKSEFYEDNNPSCVIYQNKNNKLNYKDFGSDDHLDCYAYIMKKYNCNFSESLNIIASDFNILSIKVDVPVDYVLGSNYNKQSLVTYKKPEISIVPRNWNIVDYNFWTKRYGFEFKILEEYDIVPLEYCYLHKGDKTIVFKYDKLNPMYAYRFTFDGKFSYKIYWPLSPDKKRKWLFSGGSSYNIEGEDCLPLHGDLLVITKSLKDIIALKLMGYNAISLQGEANRLEQSMVDRFLKRFKEIIILYDNDEQGVKSSNKITSNYGFRSVFIPKEYNSKDPSELIENLGFKDAKIIIDSII
jgi:5S rRNA maturation endonuclease (ribonuclease M5)